MRDKNNWGWIKCNIQKSIKFDEYTYNVINNYRGRNFTEKLRNYVYDKEKSNTIFPEKK